MTRGIAPDTLPERLQAGLAPVYLVAGEEPLLVQDACDRIRQAARDAGYLERQLLYVERGFDWSALTTAGQNQSLFAERKLIDCRIPTGKPGREGGAALQEFVEGMDDTQMLLVSCSQWDAGSRNAKWVKALAAAGVYVQIWPVNPQQLPGWIQQRLQREGFQPDRDAVQLLAQRTEGNLLAADQEISKLALLQQGGPLSGAAVEALVVDDARFDSFRLVELILRGDLAHALRTLQALKGVDMPAVMLVAALSRELRILSDFLHLTDRGISAAAAFQQLGVWRSRQPPLQKASRRLHHTDLDRVLAGLTRLDQMAKGQRHGDFWLSLERLATRLCLPRLLAS